VSLICPKCGSTSLYRDDDRQNGTKAIACVTCGFRIYKELKRRMGGEEDGAVSGEDEAREEAQRYKRREVRICNCERCGKSFEAYTRAKYCLVCRKAMKLEYDREYNSKYHKRNLKRERKQ